MRASALVAICCAVLMAAFGAWALCDRTGRDGPERPDTEGRAREAQAPEPPTLIGASASGAESERSPATTPSRWLLRGRLVGLDPVQAASARVLVFDLAVTPHADGTFEIDVTAPLSVVPRPEGLVLIGEHPDFLRASVSVRVPGRSETDPAILVCDLPMRRARTLWIRVIDDEGTPITTATVGAFPMREDVPDPWPCEEVKTDTTGSALLRLPAEGTTLLLATSDGRMPASVIVNGDAAREATLRLSSGSGIEGRVHEDGSPVAGAVLFAQADSSGRQQLHLGEIEIHWDSGRVTPALVAATTDSEGWYRMECLPGWAHRVRVERLADGRKPIGRARTESSPARDVDFDLRLGHVVLTTTCEGSPVAGASIYVFAAGYAHSLETDARGEAHADLTAHEKYSAQVDRDGYRRTRIEFQAPTVGTSLAVAVPMEAVPPHGALTVVLRDQQGKPIQTTGLAFFPAQRGDGPYPEVRFGHERDGRFRVGDLEAGRYLLVVRPGRNWDPDFTWDSKDVTWLDATTTVEVLRQGEAEIVLTARPGGRLRIDARDTAGRFLTPTCALRDASGKAVPFEIATRFGTNGGYELGGHRLAHGAPGDVAAALPPGRYRLDVTLEGFVDGSVEVDLKAGATQTMRVTLERLHGAGPDRPAPERDVRAR